MNLCCPHPDPDHDVAGDCTVRCCGCHRIQAGVRCACPYNDCWVQVTHVGEICGMCQQVCVKAREIEPHT